MLYKVSSNYPGYIDLLVNNGGEHFRSRRFVIAEFSDRKTCLSEAHELGQFLVTISKVPESEFNAPKYKRTFEKRNAWTNREIERQKNRLCEKSKAPKKADKKTKKKLK